MLAILSILLTALPFSLSDHPICQDPPPGPPFIPTLSGCQNLVNDIFAISTMQHDEPILWSQHPPTSLRSRKLPYSFKDPFKSNDCEFVVASIVEGEDDVFPTRLIAEAADGIVESCMEEGIDGAETIGTDAVGPKGVIAVVLLKRLMERGGVSGGLHPLNVTNVQLSKPGNLSGLYSSLVEDG